MVLEDAEEGYLYNSEHPLTILDGYHSYGDCEHRARDAVMQRQCLHCRRVSSSAIWLACLRSSKYFCTLRDIDLATETILAAFVGKI